MARIIFAGYLVRYPLGGYAWQMAHYLLGFRSLGHDVWFYEDTGELNCDFAYNPLTNEFAPAYEYGITATTNFFRKIGFEDRWVFFDIARGLKHGPGAHRIQTLLREADLLVSFGPVNRIPVELFHDRPAIFIDSDPIYLQLKLANEDRSLAAILDAHTHHFTFGENIGNAGSRLPTGGYTWQPTRQPIATELWENAGPPGLAYTTVGTWDSKGRDVEYQGETFTWRKRTEWCRFLDLPNRTARTFELAMDVDSVPGDVELLTANGWHVIDPIQISIDPWRYRDYLRGSRAEFTIAKDMNVRLRSGWFSDRSACYLAAGKPVVTQDTAVGNILPIGRGLFVFQSMEDILMAIDTIESDYEQHSRAARDIAEEYFAAENVLRGLIERVGL
jgi:hypothetical protein